MILLGHRTALDRFASRASELYRVPWLRVGFTESDASLRLRSLSDFGGSAVPLEIDLDRAVFELADLVYVFHVRRGGKIDRLTRRRVQQLGGESVRVVVSGKEDDVARELIEQGAVGFYLGNQSNELHASPANNRFMMPASPKLPTWMTDPEWLVHTTRGKVERMNGGATDEAIDALLLPTSDRTLADPYPVLERIVRSANLIGSCLTTDRRWPVVCFSAKPIAEVLSMRCYRPHLLRWDYEPYGIAIRRDAAISLGIRPVRYGNSRDEVELSDEEGYLFQSRGRTYDWTEESEWRAQGNVRFRCLPRDAVRIFTWSREERCRLSRLCGFDVYSVEEAIGST